MQWVAKPDDHNFLLLHTIDAKPRFTQKHRRCSSLSLSLSLSLPLSL